MKIEYIVVFILLVALVVIVFAVDTNTNEQNVYVSYNGYHKSLICSNLPEAYTITTLVEAQDKHYSPCIKCALEGSITKVTEGIIGEMKGETYDK